MRRRTLVVLSLVLAGIVAASAGFVRLRSRSRAGAGPRAAEDGPPSVRVTAASVAPLVRSVELAGSVEPVRVARLASPAEGPVLSVPVREGDLVQAGAVLVRIGRRRATEARLASQRVDLHNAQEELARVTRLVQTGALAGEALDRARAEHDRAVAQAESGEEAAGDHDVRAPWKGVVSRVLVQDGNFVAPRTALVEVFDPGSLVVRTAVPEALAARVAPDWPARVVFDAQPGRAYSARVVRVYPDLDRRLRTRTVELGVKGAGTLVPGMFARVTLDAERDDEATVIPVGAVMTANDGATSVYLYSDEHVYRSAVSLGIEDGDRVQVRAGVHPGQMVVVAGQAKVGDGALVRAKPFAPAGPDKASMRSATP